MIARVVRLSPLRAHAREARARRALARRGGPRGIGAILITERRRETVAERKRAGRLSPMRFDRVMRAFRAVPSQMRGLGEIRAGTSLADPRG